MLDFAHPLGDTVKKARIAQGLTQASVAERVAIDSRTIINIENYNDVKVGDIVEAYQIVEVKRSL